MCWPVYSTQPPLFIYKWHPIPVFDTLPRLSNVLPKGLAGSGGVILGEGGVLDGVFPAGCLEAMGGLLLDTWGTTALSLGLCNTVWESGSMSCLHKDNLLSGLSGEFVRISDIELSCLEQCLSVKFDPGWPVQTECMAGCTSMCDEEHTELIIAG